MARRRKYGTSFSWRRASGVSAAKGRIARFTGVPTTRGGQQRKLGRIWEKYISPLILAAIIIIAYKACSHR
jgi:hypothetical protein